MNEDMINSTVANLVDLAKDLENEDDALAVADRFKNALSTELTKIDGAPVGTEAIITLVDDEEVLKIVHDIIEARKEYGGQFVAAGIKVTDPDTGEEATFYTTVGLA